MLSPPPPLDSKFFSASSTQESLPPPPPRRPGPGSAPPTNAPTAEPRGPPPSRISQQSNIPIGALARNDEVTVLISGRGWAIGTIIAVLEAFNSYTGLGYKVQFLLPGERNWRTGDFSATDVRPRNNWSR